MEKLTLQDYRNGARALTRSVVMVIRNEGANLTLLAISLPVAIWIARHLIRFIY